MSLLPESASFEELVQDYFLAVRGSGLALSALDLELLATWSQQGVPFEVVARGIARAVEKAQWDARPGEPVLRTLRACRRQVEAEIKRWRDRVAGAGEAQPRAPRRTRTWEESRAERLRAALERLGTQEPALAPRLARLLELLEGAVPSQPAELDALEARVCLGLLRRLPWAERRQLWALGRAGEEDTRYLTPHTRRLARRFRLVAGVRQWLRLSE